MCAKGSVPVRSVAAALAKAWVSEPCGASSSAAFLRLGVGVAKAPSVPSAPAGMAVEGAGAKAVVMWPGAGAVISDSDTWGAAAATPGRPVAAAASAGAMATASGALASAGNPSVWMPSWPRAAAIWSGVGMKGRLLSGALAVGTGAVRAAVLLVPPRWRLCRRGFFCWRLASRASRNAGSSGNPAAAAACWLLPPAHSAKDILLPGVRPSVSAGGITWPAAAAVAAWAAAAAWRACSWRRRALLARAWARSMSAAESSMDFIATSRFRCVS